MRSAVCIFCEETATFFLYLFEGHCYGSESRRREDQTRCQPHYEIPYRRETECHRQNPTYHHLRFAVWGSVELAALRLKIMTLFSFVEEIRAIEKVDISLHIIGNT